jgi:hypothetical protein
MENPFKRRSKEQREHPIHTPVELAAIAMRESGYKGYVADLGASSAGINLNLTDEARQKLLDELVPALKSLGFK